jgi:hypothetical protein
VGGRLPAALAARQDRTLCSWKIYVKSDIVTWETQQTDYPRMRPGMPNHEPRGCPRSASYSWYRDNRPSKALQPVGDFTLKGIRRPIAAYKVLVAARFVKNIEMNDNGKHS